jgi:hypothetical protein
MGADKKKLLAILKSELEFLEKGGYRKLSWHPQAIFEDSPTCLNYHDPVNRHPCTECALMQFVPEEHRKDGVPCRQIPLDEKGETVASLYHWATQDEIEAHVRKWLEKNIHKLEAELEVAETESVQAKNPMDPRPWRDDAPE